MVYWLRMMGTAPANMASSRYRVPMAPMSSTAYLALIHRSGGGKGVGGERGERTGGGKDERGKGKVSTRMCVPRCRRMGRWWR